jgi:nicotinate-nucleotide pyrophosphorylase (carboxylating)
MRDEADKLLKEPHVHRMIRMALEEDLAEVGDATTKSLVPEDTIVKAALIAKCECIVSGTKVAEEVFKDQDRHLKFEIEIFDGQKAKNGEIIMSIEGKARAVLTAERTALNFMQRMTGIATQTRAFVDIAKPHGVKILDTRKTSPCSRVFEKYAVKCGGGTNHRKGLYDMVMIKDNHRKLWSVEHEMSLDLAIEEVRRHYQDIPIEVEVETEEELRSALAGNPDWVLLDNMSIDLMKRCVEICDKQCSLEASGGITMDNIEGVVTTGVDAISLGCLTHSVPSADLSLEIV